ncbi:hypothetical protein ACWF2L_30535 [Streptomyces anulatus]
MPPKHPLHITAVHWIGFGMVAGFFVNSLCLLATGSLPSPSAAFIGAQAVTLASSVAFVVHVRKRRAALEAQYRAPALGEGIDTPHRPPTDPADPTKS